MLIPAPERTIHPETLQKQEILKQDNSEGLQDKQQENKELKPKKHPERLLE